MMGVLPCKTPLKRGVLHGVYLAEAVRFELTDPFESPVFKTGAIDHSATLPWCLIVTSYWVDSWSRAEHGT